MSLFFQTTITTFILFITLSFGLYVPEQQFVPTTSFSHQFGEFPATFVHDIQSPQHSSVNSYPYHNSNVRLLYSDNHPNQGIHSQHGLNNNGYGSPAYGHTNGNFEQVKAVKDEQNTLNSHSSHQSRVNVVREGGGYTNREPYLIRK